MELPERMLAHSERLVLPRMMAPASRRRVTSGASRPGALSTKAREPAVVGMSAVSILSLRRIGRPRRDPWSGGGGWSSSRAGLTAMTALNGSDPMWSTLWISASEPSIARALGNCPSRIAAAVGGWKIRPPSSPGRAQLPSSFGVAQADSETTASAAAISPARRVPLNRSCGRRSPDTSAIAAAAFHCPEPRGAGPDRASFRTGRCGSAGRR